MSISTPTSGELRHRITLIRRVEVPDTEVQAGVYQTDTPIMTCWAKIEPTGATYWNNAQVEQKATHRFWFRAVKNKSDSFSISHGVFIKSNGRLYRPIHVRDSNDGVWVVVEAMELGAYKVESAINLIDEVLNG